jgi:hypothetical protein
MIVAEKNRFHGWAHEACGLKQLPHGLKHAGDITSSTPENRWIKKQLPQD